MGSASTVGVAAGHVRLGLRENWQQFALLVVINAFVGGMVGLERTVVPLVGTEEFGIPAGVVTFSFVIAFGVVKALTNLVAGIAADRITRKNILIAGWLIGLPVPFLIAWAPSWGLIVVANVLLGINQGLAWSMTVTMKIDLVGPRGRGLAMGLNEAAGYGAVGLTALATGYIAANSGLRPEPFYLGIAYAILGLVLSAVWVKDTGDHARHDARQHATTTTEPATPKPTVKWVVIETSWRNRTLFGASQAGHVNNLNDGMSWAVFPILFATAGLSVADIGIIKAIYPIIWGVGQPFTGALADRIGRKPLIVWGMITQAAGHLVIGLGLERAFLSGVTGSVLLGAGTAMVYPALLATISDAAHPSWRASSIGVYRTWRDLGYAIGAAMASLVVAVSLDLEWAVHIAGLLTLTSGVIAWRTMHETLIPQHPTDTNP